MTPYTLLAIYGWVASVYFVLCLLWDAQAWVVTSRLYSGIPWRHAAAMFTLVSRSRIHYYLWSPLVPLAIIIAFAAARVVFPFVFTLSLLLFWAHILLYQVMPPSVLLLGTSRHETLQFRHQLERALYPYRVVVLLEPASALAASDGVFTKNQFEWDNLRTSSGLWRSSVFGLIEAVPVIVVDARVPADGVVEEIRRLASHGLVDKALFVADEEGLAPALAVAGAEVQEGSVLGEVEVAKRLKHSRLIHTTSPDDDPILRRLSSR